MIALLPVFTDKVIIKENPKKSKNKQKTKKIFLGICINYGTGKGQPLRAGLWMYKLKLPD